MKISRKDLILLGAALYVSEGTRARIYKNGKKIFSIEFTNKDPRLIKVFLRFLREIIKAYEERIKAELFIYPEHDEETLVNYWTEVTSIPKERFNKTIRLKQKNIKYIPNPLGTLKIRYHHKEHFHQLQSIIDRVFNI